MPEQGGYYPGQPVNGGNAYSAGIARNSNITHNSGNAHTVGNAQNGGYAQNSENAHNGGDARNIGNNGNISGSSYSGNSNTYRPDRAFPYSRSGVYPTPDNGYINGGYVNNGSGGQNQRVNSPANPDMGQLRQSSRMQDGSAGGQPRQSPDFRGYPDSRHFQNAQTEPAAEAANPPKNLTENSENEAEKEAKKAGLLSLLDGIKLDPEKTTLILMIVILARNGADITLIMALAYLLM